MSLLLCIMLLSAPDAISPVTPMAPLWTYHLNELHESISSGDYYAAKQSLAFLARYDQAAYTEKKFDLTGSWIAAREKNWDTAYQLGRQAGLDTPGAALELALSLEQMGRYQEALDEIFSRKINLRGAVRWRAYALAARCYSALDDHPAAIKYYRKLISKSVPVMYRTESYSRLCELYYEAGNKKQARRLAESVQRSHPTSDAALYTLHLQESNEDESYLGRAHHMERLAEVCYKNREFERSNHYYQQLRDNVPAKAAKARYYLALTLSKQGQSEQALEAFGQIRDELAGSGYEGQAAFQYARTLYMLERDQETIDAVDAYRARYKQGKWPKELLRLSILSLRRLDDLESFRHLAHILKAEQTPRWLWRYYHRNGMIWAMQEGRIDEAADHLEAYRRQGLRGEARLEADLWSGLVAWNQGAEDDALNRWLKILEKDPNHYYGLVARQLVQMGMGEREQQAYTAQQLDSMSLIALRKAYYQAREIDQAAIGARLMERFLEERPSFDFSNEPEEVSMEMAEIGRFDWAARILPKKRKKYLANHLHKARLYYRAHDVEESVRHAEILVNSYPKWVPYELMPRDVQELFFPRGHGELVADRAGRRGVDPYLLLAIIREESRFDHNAKSWASARGLMQFIPSTAREMATHVDGLEQFQLPMLYDPEVAISLGAAYVDHLLDVFDGEAIYAVAAYNAGESASGRWRDSSRSPSLGFVWDVAYSETKRYCQKVMRAYHHYQRLYGTGQPVIKTPDLTNLASL